MSFSQQWGAVQFRNIRQEDEIFLRELYASTRADELAPLDWSDAQKRAFLEMQFRAQHTYYQQQFGRASFQVIELAGQPIGRLYTDRRGDEIRVLDIALLPEYRGKGLGTALMRELLAEAAQSRKPVRIHVERFNPALRLYERLGFHTLEDQGVYFLMECPPAVSNPAPSRHKAQSP